MTYKHLKVLEEENSASHLEWRHRNEREDKCEEVCLAVMDVHDGMVQLCGRKLGTARQRQQHLCQDHLYVRTCLSQQYEMRQTQQHCLQLYTTADMSTYTAFCVTKPAKVILF
jgi:hypothetical protein